MNQSSRNCPKEAYRTWSAAVRVIKRMENAERHTGRTIHGQAPYRCGDHFHLTSNSYTIKKKRAA
jgi:hypothetical protein